MYLVEFITIAQNQKISITVTITQNFTLITFWPLIKIH